MSKIYLPTISKTGAAGRNHRCLITQVTKDSPADDANLQENDIIQKIDDTEIKSVDDLKAELSKYMPGERVTLTILRDGKTKEVRLTLGTTKNK